MERLSRFDRRGMVLLVLLALSAVATSATPQSTAADPRDVGVYQAILDKTIRAEVNRFNTHDGLPQQPVVTFDRSLALCRASENYQTLPGCVIDENVMQVFAREAPAGRRPVVFPTVTADVRKELVLAFRARNATSQPIAGSALGGVTLVSSGPEALEAARGRVGGIASFSLPAYSSDGCALVYAHTWCPRCGHGWLFLLQQDAASWTVISVEDLWIS